MLQEFILTAYALVSAKKWDELHDYFALIREILTRPKAVLTLGKPHDKPLE